MTFAREGMPYVASAAGLAVVTFAVSVRRRSWPLWLLGLSLVVAALLIAFASRDASAPTLVGQLPPR